MVVIADLYMSFKQLRYNRNWQNTFAKKLLLQQFSDVYYYFNLLFLLDILKCYNNKYYTISIVKAMITFTF